MIIAAIDPSLRAFGCAKFLFTEGELRPLDLLLIKTEKEKSKTIRVNSDDLRRAREIHREVRTFIHGADIIFSEVPSGAQSARAAWALGIAVGIIAGLPQIIEVQPAETKLAAVGTKTASKKEMIEWATGLYPDAPWKISRGIVTLDNEHLADACGVAHAGIRTVQFQQLMALKRAA